MEKECDDSQQVVFLRSLNPQCPLPPGFLASPFSAFRPQLEAFSSDSLKCGMGAFPGCRVS